MEIGDVAARRRVLAAAAWSAAVRQQQCDVIGVHVALAVRQWQSGDSGVAAVAGSSVVHERGSSSASRRVVVRMGCAVGCRS